MQIATRHSVEARLLELAIVLSIVLAGAIVVSNLGIDRMQQYTLLAQAFLDGRLDIGSDLSHYDEPTASGDRNYLPLGPAPALLLLPFVAVAEGFGVFFRQGYLSFVLTAGVFWAALRLARRLGHDREDGYFLAFAFVFGSAFLGVAVMSISNFLAHVVVNLLLLLALLEFFGRRRPLWIGTALGLVLASRLTAGIGAGFFVAALMLRPEPLWSRLRQVALLLTPILIAGLSLLFYNEARFGSLFDTGYGTQAVPDPLQQAARSYGLLSLRHVPGNLYYMLLSLPLPVFEEGTVSVFKLPGFRPNPWGMSLLVTSPWLAYGLRLPRTDRLVRLSLASSVVIALPLMLTWSMGAAQYGYRFALDFMPFLWLAFAIGFARRGQGLPLGFKGCCVAAAIVNAYLLGVMMWSGG